MKHQLSIFRIYVCIEFCRSFWYGDKAAWSRHRVYAARVCRRPVLEYNLFRRKGYSAAKYGKTDLILKTNENERENHPARSGDYACCAWETNENENHRTYIDWFGFGHNSHFSLRRYVGWKMDKNLILTNVIPIKM